MPSRLKRAASFPRCSGVVWKRGLQLHHEALGGEDSFNHADDATLVVHGQVPGRRRNMVRSEDGCRAALQPRAELAFGPRGRPAHQVPHPAPSSAQRPSASVQPCAANETCAERVVHRRDEHARVQTTRQVHEKPGGARRGHSVDDGHVAQIEPSGSVHADPAQQRQRGTDRADLHRLPRRHPPQAEQLRRAGVRRSGRRTAGEHGRQ